MLLNVEKHAEASVYITINHATTKNTIEIIGENSANNTAHNVIFANLRM